MKEIKSAKVENDGKGLIISVPMTNHTPDTLRNLIVILYQHAELMSRATGGRFEVSNDVIRDVSCQSDNKSVVVAVRKHSKDLLGLEMTQKEIRFTGYPATQDPDTIEAFTALSELINVEAIRKLRVFVRTKPHENDAYTMRTWIVRIGMIGKRYETTRRILVEKLTGNSAICRS
jgi:hypothetical protein